MTKRLPYFYILPEWHIGSPFGLPQWQNLFNCSRVFIYVCHVRYVRRGMGGKFATKNIEWFRRCRFAFGNLPMVSIPFREKWESGVWNQGIFKILFYVLSASWVKMDKLCSTLSLHRIIVNYTNVLKPPPPPRLQKNTFWYTVA